MGMPSTAARTTVLFMLIGGGLCVAAVLGLTLSLPFVLQEADRDMVIENTSGRALLVERSEVPGSDNVPRVLVTHAALWSAAGCSPDELVARDLSGAVVARRRGVCPEDTWRITAEGLPPAPAPPATSVAPDDVEVAVRVMSTDDLNGLSVEWARRLPSTLDRTRATARAAGATVEGPYLEQQGITFYLRGPDPARLLELARDDLLQPAPGDALAWGGTRGGRAPASGPPSVTLLDPHRRPVPLATADPSTSAPAVPEHETDPPVRE